MDTNKKIIVENLSMIDLSRPYGINGEADIDYTLQALEELGIGNITSIDHEYAPPLPPAYGEKERIDATFLDDLGNTFIMHVDMFGYVYYIDKIDQDGNKSFHVQPIPMND